VHPKCSYTCVRKSDVALVKINIFSYTKRTTLTLQFFNVWGSQKSNILVCGVPKIDKKHSRTTIFNGIAMKSLLYIVHISAKHIPTKRIVAFRYSYVVLHKNHTVYIYIYIYIHRKQLPQNPNKCSFFHGNFYMVKTGILDMHFQIKLK